MANDNQPDKVIYSMHRVTKRHGQREVLKDISLGYFYGAKIGVLGLNGAGKSSLLKIMAGVDKAFDGDIVVAPGYSIGYLEQEPLVDETRTVREVVEEGVQEIVDLVKEFNEINEAFADPEADFLRFVRAVSGEESIDYNLNVAISEREYGYLNAAIANLLKYHGTIENDIESVLHFYFLMCSVEMSCRELSLAFLAFANHRRKFDYAGITLTSSQVKRMNAIMQTCGFYDEAGEFSYLVGLPGKSGVGGGIVAIYPLQYSVAVWSPRLNPKGNSVMGIKALELLTSYTKESIF